MVANRKAFEIDVFTPTQTLPEQINIGKITYDNGKISAFSHQIDFNQDAIKNNIQARVVP